MSGDSERNRLFVEAVLYRYRACKVAEITNTDHFRDLQSRSA